MYRIETSELEDAFCDSDSQRVGNSCAHHRDEDWQDYFLSIAKELQCDRVVLLICVREHLATES